MNKVAVAEELVKIAKSLMAGQRPFSFVVNMATQSPERAFAAAKKMPYAEDSIRQCSTFRVANEGRILTLEQAKKRAIREYEHMRGLECRAIALWDASRETVGGWFFYGLAD